MAKSKKLKKAQSNKKNVKKTTTPKGVKKKSVSIARSSQKSAVKNTNKSVSAKKAPRAVKTTKVIKTKKLVATKKTVKTVKKVANKSIKASSPKKKPSLSKKSSGQKNKTVSSSAQPRWENFLTPLDDRVLVLIEGQSEKTPGGLYIPDMVRERPNRGLVLVAGRGHRNKNGQIQPLDVKVGDRVIFNEYSGSKISAYDENLLILRESEIIGITEG